MHVAVWCGAGERRPSAHAVCGGAKTEDVNAPTPTLLGRPALGLRHPLVVGFGSGPATTPPWAPLAQALPATVHVFSLERPVATQDQLLLRLEHLALTPDPVTVSLDLFVAWTVVAAEEMALAGTVARTTADSERWNWRRDSGADIQRSPAAPIAWTREEHAATHAPDIDLAPWDVRTFLLTVAPAAAALRL